MEAEVSGLETKRYISHDSMLTLTSEWKWLWGQVHDIPANNPSWIDAPKTKESPSQPYSTVSVPPLSIQIGKMSYISYNLPLTCVTEKIRSSGHCYTAVCGTMLRTDLLPDYNMMLTPLALWSPPLHSQTQKQLLPFKNFKVIMLFLIVSCPLCFYHMWARHCQMPGTCMYLANIFWW